MAEFSTSVLDQDERRSFARLALDAGTRVAIRNTNPFHRPPKIADADGVSLPPRLTDISFSGARVVAPSPLGSEGDTLELLLQGEDYDPLTLAGRVVRLETVPNGHALALHFYNVAVQDQQRLAGILYTWSKLAANSKGVRRAPISPWTRSLGL